MRVRGLTLVEVLVAAGLFAMAAMLILGLLPTGILSLRQAEDLQAATAWGLLLVDEAPPEPGRESLELELEGRRFRARREVRDLGGGLDEVRVRVEWEGARRPVELELLRHEDLP